MLFGQVGKAHPGNRLIRQQLILMHTNSPVVTNLIEGLRKTTTCAHNRRLALIQN